jgi:hypothetical protein
LRQAFARWGRPLQLKVDNGHPWGATGGLPTVLELWAAGLGVGLIRNPPRRPQKNGVVERSQGTAKCWAEPSQCVSVEQLQQRINEEDWLQREAYAEDEGASRRQKYPALLHSGRGYACSGERAFWDLERVVQLLAGVEVVRKVSPKGKVSLYDRSYQVGTAYGGQMVRVGLDPQTREWVIRRSDAEELRRHPAVELDAERIMALRISPPR